ncbi:hypothetical protein VKT23_008688 [Stygiomarasmius scandens]|uniref:Uncharacterized protein n=1 Tax=Marasmiellus scandens TaxID=2682957 RepID=A0ABR1JNA3_9AGAR
MNLEIPVPFESGPARPHLRRHPVRLYHPYYPVTFSGIRRQSGTVKSNSGIPNDQLETFSVTSMDLDSPYAHRGNPKVEALYVTKKQTEDIDQNKLDKSEAARNQMTGHSGFVDRLMLEDLRHSLKTTKEVMATFHNPPVRPEFMMQIEEMILAVENEINSGHYTMLDTIMADV